MFNIFQVYLVIKYILLVVLLHFRQTDGCINKTQNRQTNHIVHTKGQTWNYVDLLEQKNVIMLQKARLTYNTLPFYGDGGVTANKRQRNAYLMSLDGCFGLVLLCSALFSSAVFGSVWSHYKILISYFSQVQVLHRLRESCVGSICVCSCRSNISFSTWFVSVCLFFLFNFVFSTFFRQMSVFGILNKSVNCSMMAFGNICVCFFSFYIFCSCNILFIILNLFRSWLFFNFVFFCFGCVSVALG